MSESFTKKSVYQKSRINWTVAGWLICNQHCGCRYCANNWKFSLKLRLANPPISSPWRVRFFSWLGSARSMFFNFSSIFPQFLKWRPGFLETARWFRQSGRYCSQFCCQFYILLRAETMLSDQRWAAGEDRTAWSAD